MKKLKSLFATFFALACVCAMSTAAFAQTLTPAVILLCWYLTGRNLLALYQSLLRMWDQRNLPWSRFLR